MEPTADPTTLFIQTALEPGQQTYINIDVKSLLNDRQPCLSSLDCILCDAASCDAAESKTALAENAYNAMRGQYKYATALEVSCRPAMAFPEGTAVDSFIKTCSWEGEWEDKAEVILDCECEIFILSRSLCLAKTKRKDGRNKWSLRTSPEATKLNFTGVPRIFNCSQFQPLPHRHICLPFQGSPAPILPPLLWCPTSARWASTRTPATTSSATPPSWTSTRT